MIVNIIGAGLAGCECAWILARNNIKVNLYEMKLNKKTDAHKSNDFSELVCSNSLKSKEATNACGLLKKEMEYFDSLFIESAYKNEVKAGNALAVDRKGFSKYITDKIRSNENINVIDKEVNSINEVLKEDELLVIATGPLTSDSLSYSIKEYIGMDNLYFYDAAAPIVEADSIDMNKAFKKDRYKEDGDYINLPMNKEEYMKFYNELINGESADRHEFDKIKLFEGCMPIEFLAKRGEKSLTFGPLKPVGLDNPKTLEKYYAVAQLRSENKDNTSYNLVGFQTSLKFGEQKRIFSLMPGLENANFLRYGVMHRNTYINGCNVLDNNFNLKSDNKIYFAGQISGVEGYVESAASGLMIALNILAKLNNDRVEYPLETMLGSLSNYISVYTKNFQPMNANFGIIKPLGYRIKDKKLKYSKYAEISLCKMEELRNRLRYIK